MERIGFSQASTSRGSTVFTDFGVNYQIAHCQSKMYNIFALHINFGAPKRMEENKRKQLGLGKTRMEGKNDNFEREQSAVTPRCLPTDAGILSSLGSQ